uniref:Radical SAM superfamily enzyme, MoaA/NifB/PqqE/SkfB family n=1 Tax=Candidatus Kentrum sp. MB TaxID=2138164 RepID=A0A450XS39_9GAMM|nr:MAG: Radical SAM superfamily enzyme, MoaA/NifB/PqqE/SkfB family [Candidatus Kentron sp. MB]
MHRFVLRQERFGGLIFDRQHHTISAVDDREYTMLQREPRFDVARCAEYQKGCETLVAPTKVFFVLTKKCNLRCLHCSNDSDPRRDEIIPLSTVELLLTECQEMGVFEIAINGGEPLTHPDFFTIVSSIKQHGFPLYLNTNGVCSRKTLDKLCDTGIESIKISFEGLRENHDKIRGKGNFDRALHAVRRLKKAGCHVRLNYTLMEENRADCFGLVRLADELACDLKIAPLIPVGRARSLSPPPYIAGSGFQQELDSFCRENRIKISVEMMLEMETGNCALVEKGLSYQHTPCGIRHVHLSIDSDGKAYSTGRQTDFCAELEVGNVYVQSLSAIWQQAAAKNRAAVGRCGFCSRTDVRTVLGSSFPRTDLHTTLACPMPKG